MDEWVIPNFEYSEEDFIYSAPTWDEHKKHSQLSKFDQLLGHKWEHAMERGAFNYILQQQEKQQRIIPGKHQFVLNLSLDRAKKRRAPEYIDQVDKPFDPKKFNFNKVKRGEVLMNFCPTHSQGCVHVATQNGHIAGDELEKRDETEGPTEDGKHLIIINNSPFEYGHVLLVPNVDKCINQKITMRGLELAVEMMLLSNHPGLRIAFNGLCALASVNHQHLHGWYMDSPIWIENAPAQLVAGICYEVVDRLSRAFMFQLKGSSVEKLVSAVYAITNYFQENDIAHHLFVTRGVVFGESPDSSKTTIRILVWPRKHYIGAKNIRDSDNLPLFHVAVAELGGHIPIYQPGRFHDLTEAEVVAVIQRSLLPDEEFNHLRSNLQTLMTSLEQQSLS